MCDEVMKVLMFVCVYTCSGFLAIFRLNSSFIKYVCLYVCMYVCMYVCIYCTRLECIYL